MSKQLEALKAILEEKLQNEAEIAALIAKFTIASAKGSVAIEGDATEAVIITGNKNIVGNNNRVVINQNTDPETLVKKLHDLLQTNDIHQNTQGGDAAARDINKSNTYENCTFIQLLAKDSNLKNISQDSLKDLDFSSIPQESIQQAYQDALPPDAGVWDLKGNNLTQILQNLEEFRRLSNFLNRLSQDENVPQEIRSTLIALAEGLASKKPQNDNNAKLNANFSSHKEGQLESYLIVTIERCDDDNEQFILNAWLIKDDSAPANDISKYSSLLERDEQQVGTLCKFNDIPKKINKFLKTSLKYLRGKQYQLIIEVFLPIDLIGTEIDRWKISDPIVEDITLGIKYPIRLRSLERLNLEYLDYYLSDWYNYWNKVKTVLHNELVQELFEHLEEMETFNWKLLRNSLKEKIGLKVTCAPPKAKNKDLFKAILTATTPIAIWPRYDIPNFEQVAEIDKILSLKPLCHLCESVRELRQQADAQTEPHLGFHLALLWEDPNRLTPNVMLELTPPGQ